MADNVNMRYFLILLTTLATLQQTNAQSAADSVKATINQLFAGMKNADATLLKSAFSDSAILQTISRTKEGKTVVLTDSIDEFAVFVSQLKKDSADERISFETIKIDGPLAIAWTPYQFYHNGMFSHCGVNSFQLVRINGVWKIQYLIDTRRRQGCQ
jgi:Putative lumazine-binding